MPAQFWEIPFGIRGGHLQRLQCIVFSFQSGWTRRSIVAGGGAITFGARNARPLGSEECEDLRSEDCLDRRFADNALP